MKYVNVILFLVCCSGAIARGAAGKNDECDNPMSTLFSVLGEEMLEGIKMKMDYKTKSCLLIRPPKELKMVMKTCLVEFAMTAINDTFNSTMPVDPSNLSQWYGEFCLCKLDGMGIPYELDQVFDPVLFREKMMMDKWKGKPEHVGKFKDILFNCADSSANAAGVLEQTFAIDKCTTGAIKSYCESQGEEEPGLMWTQAFHSLMEEPRCADVKLPQNYLDAGESCFNEYVEKWNAKPPTPEKDEPEMKKTVRSVMDFAKNYSKEVVFKTFECLGEKMEYYNSSLVELDYLKIKETVLGFEGWKNEDKVEVQNAFDECVSFEEDEDSTEDESDESTEDEEDMMDMMENYMEMFKDHSKFQKCFAPKFMATCGLNNDVSKFLYPTMNKYVLSLVVEDVREREETKSMVKIMESLRKMLEEEEEE